MCHIGHGKTINVVGEYSFYGFRPVSDTFIDKVPVFFRTSTCGTLALWLLAVIRMFSSTSLHLTTCVSHFGLAATGEGDEKSNFIALENDCVLNVSVGWVVGLFRVPSFWLTLILLAMGVGPWAACALHAESGENPCSMDSRRVGQE